jgi:DNA-binding NarL/FixJ family response regulator
MEVLGEAANGAEALALARLHRPTVMLMDVRMPVVDGIQATAQITVDPVTPDVRVLILTTFDLDEYVYAALRAGASGFMLKDTSPEELLAGIRIVAAGEGLLSPRVTRRLIQEFAKRPETKRADPAMLDVLTEREREVLEQVARGSSNSEIADALNISPSTAKTHVSRVLMKLDARDRVQLVVIAYDTGLATSR